MAQASKDDNNVSTMLGTLNTDGETPTNVKVDVTNHSVDVLDGASGSDLGDDIASRDNNNITVMMGVSSTDGTTPTSIYVNSSNQILIDTA